MDPILGGIAVTAGNAVAQGVSNNINNRTKYEYWKKQMAETDRYNQMAEKRQLQYNKEFQDYVYAQNLAQWNRENDYNSPAAQMARYKSAGLNANLIYGQSNTAAASPDMTIGNQSATPANVAPPSVNDAVNVDSSATIQNQLQSKMIDAQIANLTADTANKILDNDIGKETKDDVVASVAQTLQNLKSENQNVIESTEKIKAETALIHQEMIKTKFETDFAEYHSKIEELLYDKEKANKPYYEKNSFYDNRIKFQQLQFLNRQTQKINKELQYWDKDKANQYILQAAQVAGLDSQTDATTLQTKLNKILFDPDVESDKYWSAIALRAMASGADKFGIHNITDLVNTIKTLLTGD